MNDLRTPVSSRSSRLGHPGDPFHRSRKRNSSAAGLERDPREEAARTDGLRAEVPVEAFRARVGRAARSQRYRGRRRESFPHHPPPLPKHETWSHVVTPYSVTWAVEVAAKMRAHLEFEQSHASLPSDAFPPSPSGNGGNRRHDKCCFAFFSPSPGPPSCRKDLPAPSWQSIATSDEAASTKRAVAGASDESSSFMAAAQRIGVQLRPTALTDGAGAGTPAARTLPRIDWSALFGVSCNALLAAG